MPPKKSHCTCVECGITLCLIKCGAIKGQKFPKDYIGNLTKHVIDKHAGQGSFFNLLCGTTLMISARKRNNLRVNELYKDKFGQPITEKSKVPEEFLL